MGYVGREWEGCCVTVPTCRNICLLRDTRADTLMIDVNKCTYEHTNTHVCGGKLYTQQLNANSFLISSPQTLNMKIRISAGIQYL